jgi:hypothetical protein
MVDVMNVSLTPGNGSTWSLYSSNPAATMPLRTWHTGVTPLPEPFLRTWPGGSPAEAAPVLRTWPGGSPVEAAPVLRTWGAGNDPVMPISQPVAPVTPPIAAAVLPTPVVGAPVPPVPPAATTSGNSVVKPINVNNIVYAIAAAFVLIKGIDALAGKGRGQTPAAPQQQQPGTVVVPTEEGPPVQQQQPMPQQPQQQQPGTVVVPTEEEPPVQQQAPQQQKPSSSPSAEGDVPAGFKNHSLKAKAVMPQVLKKFGFNGTTLTGFDKEELTVGNGLHNMLSLQSKAPLYWAAKVEEGKNGQPGRMRSSTMNVDGLNVNVGINRLPLVFNGQSKQWEPMDVSKTYTSKNGATVRFLQDEPGSTNPKGRLIVESPSYRLDIVNMGKHLWAQGYLTEEKLIGKGVLAETAAEGLQKELPNAQEFVMKSEFEQFPFLGKKQPKATKTETRTKATE